MQDGVMQPQHLDPPQLTARIKRCQDWQALQAVLEEHGERFNAIHASALATCCAQLAGTPAAQAPATQGQRALMQQGSSSEQEAQQQHQMFVKQLIQLVSAHVEDYQPRQTANTLWALAKLLQRQRPLAAAAGPVMQRLLLRASQQWRDFQARELAMALHAAAALPQGPPAAEWLAQWQAAAAQHLQSGQGLEPQDLSVCLMAMGKLRMQPTQPLRSLLQDALAQAAQQLSAADAANCLYGLASTGFDPGTEWLAGFAAATRSRLAEQGSRLDLLVSLLAWSRLGQTPPPQWLQPWLAAMAPRLAGCTAGELAACLHALARLGVRPTHGWLQEWMRAAEPVLQQASCQEAGMLLWALAKLRCRPSAAWLAQAVAAHASALGEEVGSMDAAAATATAPRTRQRCTAAPGAPALPAHAASVACSTAIVLWALGRLGYVPGRALLEQLLRAGLASRAHASPQALACMLVGLARLRVRPSRSWLPGTLLAIGAPCAETTAQGMAMVLWALATMQVRPTTQWLASWCEAALHRLPQASPRQLAVLLWALARLQHHPGERFVALSLQLLAAAAPHMAPQSAALAAWALATLGISSSRTHLYALLAGSVAQAGAYRPLDWSLSMWALAKLHQMPPPAWASAMYAHTQAQLHEFRGRELANLVWAVAQLPDYSPPTWWVEALHARARELGAAGAAPMDNSTLYRALSGW